MFDVKSTNDIVLLIWIGLAALLGKFVRKKKVMVFGQEEERYSIFFAIVVFFPIFWFVTTVYARSDMYAYWTDFNNSNMTISETIHNWDSINRGPGYYLIIAISKSLGVTDFQGFRVVLALLQSIPLILVYYSYSTDYIYSVFLFIATMSYDGWMMNGMRQFLAATMIFAALPFLLKKRYVAVLIIILFAITVHQSAIIMIPVYIISNMKPWSKTAILTLLLFTVVLYFYIGRSSWISEETLQESQGSNPIRIVINAIPVVLAFIGRKQIMAADNQLINICVNISIITVCIYSVSSVTSGIMVGRLPGYTMIFNFLLFPYLLSRVFNEKISKNLKFLITVFYVAFFIFDLYFI